MAKRFLAYGVAVVGVVLMCTTPFWLAAVGLALVVAGIVLAGEWQGVGR